MADAVCTITRSPWLDINLDITARVQCLRTKRWRPLDGRRQRPIRRLRMELYLHCLLWIHRLADHSRHWSALQRPGSTKVRIGLAFPIAHDCSRVCVRFALVVAAIEGPFTNTKGYLEQPSNGYSGVIL